MRSTLTFNGTLDAVGDMGDHEAGFCIERPDDAGRITVTGLSQANCREVGALLFRDCFVTIVVEERKP